jgi:hypothetical protein
MVAVVCAERLIAQRAWPISSELSRESRPSLYVVVDQCNALNLDGSRRPTPSDWVVYRGMFSVLLRSTTRMVRAMENRTHQVYFSPRRTERGMFSPLQLPRLTFLRWRQMNGSPTTPRRPGIHRIYHSAHSIATLPVT